MQNDPKVFNDASRSSKAALFDIQKEISIPPITPRMANEPAPWLEAPIQVNRQNSIQKKVDPEVAAEAVTTRMSNFDESNRPTVNIYTQANGTTSWACFIK